MPGGFTPLTTPEVVGEQRALLEAIGGEQMLNSKSIIFRSDHASAKGFQPAGLFFI